ncbi:MAG: hypothetical protein K9J37_23520 [Saprospiraceae bacterium]|nr:hypothetical protein [Saprospiraceae bacterium]MCF8252896.1 hypothetical protein [Saprospiraceae bacterium]MCF8314444.1 hypothetical protein [Saprospiraceae bacterium]
MKKLLALCLFSALLPMCIFAQSSKSKKGTSILASTSFSIYSPLKPYTFKKEYYIKSDDLLLNFITNNSGTFVIEEGDSILLTSMFESKMPSQLVGIGGSIQFRNLKNVFHEVSLTRLSLSRSDRVLNYSGTYSDGTKLGFPSQGAKESMFLFAFRYEFGKYFGRNKDAVLRFVIAGGIEPSYFRYKSTPYSSSDYPLSTKLITIDLALIPMLSAKLSKSLSLDFKFIPNFLTADFGTMKRNDPTLPKRQQGGFRNYKSPDMTWAFSVQLRYMVKEAKKQRGG